MTRQMTKWRHEGQAMMIAENLCRALQTPFPKWSKRFSGVLPKNSASFLLFVRIRRTSVL